MKRLVNTRPTCNAHPRPCPALGKAFRYKCLPRNKHNDPGPNSIVKVINLYSTYQSFHIKQCKKPPLISHPLVFVSFFSLGIAIVYGWHKLCPPPSSATCFSFFQIFSQFKQNFSAYECLECHMCAAMFPDLTASHLRSKLGALTVAC